MDTDTPRDQLNAPPGRPPIDRYVILAVEDDALILMCAVDMLEDLGHLVIQSHSGAAALAVLRSELHVDLLLTDFSMPNMNGLELATAARNLRPNLPVLLATGFGDSNLGPSDDLPRLIKPYLQDDLAVALSRLLFNSSGVGETEK